MISFFRRKKPDAAPAADAPPEEARDASLTAGDPTQPLASENIVSHQTPPAPAMSDRGTSEPASERADAQGGHTPAPAGKSGWRDRLRNSGFARSFSGLFSRNPRLDDDLLDEIETALLTADVGVSATTQLVEALRKRMKAREFADAQALLAALRAELIAMLAPVSKPLRIEAGAKPFVILTVGVNGVGKTTTIGKLARRYRDEGRSLMLAAGDTFRAAAVEQLQVWGERNQIPVIAQHTG
ncbi:MAG: signal recognition particle-docking protein FtsY, partial [Lysobacteraceae bacterium]